MATTSKKKGAAKKAAPKSQKKTGASPKKVAKKASSKKKAPAKKAVAVKVKAKGAGQSTNGFAARVRMYNQQDLGDCFLLQFEKDGRNSWILIDFGSYQGGNATREKEIALHIKEAVGNDDFRIVVTHQHKDHISGFVNAAKEMEGMKVDELWLSFLDDKSNTAGDKVRTTLKKYWDKNNKLNGLVSKVLGAHQPVKNMLAEKEGLDLFADHQTGGQAYVNLQKLAKNNVKFWQPGQHFALPGFEEEVKVYVLGPPVDSEAILAMNPKKGEDVDGLTLANELNSATDFLMHALESIDTGKALREQDFPFERKYYTPVTPAMRKNTSGDETPQGLYCEDKKEWRQIEYEWVKDMGRLALHMDKLTNNTSLVLAFELVKSKKVMLFVGDAQIGNWKSWFNVKFENSDVSAEDLLKRTVLYKAGHHSSHNATYRQGLDLMNEEELVIMIPINQQISDKFRFLMGKPPMIQGYNRKAHGRVLRTDTIYQSAKGMGQLKFPFSTSIKGTNLNPKNATANQLYIEYEVR